MEIIDDDVFTPVLHSGDRLYHYTNAEGVKGICEGEFWITEKSFLNDKTEFQIGSQIFVQIIDEEVSCRESARKVKERVLREVEYYHKMAEIGDSEAYAGDYVMSFSLDYDSALMWSEFSNFGGYSITFEHEKLLNSFGKQLILHGTVIYETEKQKAMMMKKIEEEVFHEEEFYYLNSWSDFNLISDAGIEDCCRVIPIIVDGYNYFFKTDCFAGEKEYRFVFTCGHDGGLYKPEQLDKQYFRIKNGVLIPFVKKQFKPSECIEEILIGPKQNSDIAELGIKYFMRNLKLDVPVKKSSMPLRY
ncbi:MAG: DUF2971 domain-containing protein [Oscillospiraceae bacterium]|nr:DUF2971 domain-containing protein [Oscillospiraceae bacterium]